MNLSKKLTLRQKKFADEFIKTGNATEAAIAAGYSKKYANTNAHRLLKLESVQIYIQARLKKLDKDTIADQTEILETLTKILRCEDCL